MTANPNIESEKPSLKELLRQFDLEELPSLLREIAEVADLESALIIASLKGGGKAYFSNTPKAGSWLADAVGLEKAMVIGQALAPATGVTLEVPMGAYRITLNRLLTLQMRRKGKSQQDIARQLKVHTRTVQRYCVTLREKGLIN
jgi:DNA-binding NarL/FixJ family response regulator